MVSEARLKKNTEQLLGGDVHYHSGDIAEEKDACVARHTMKQNENSEMFAVKLLFFSGCGRNQRFTW